MTLDKEAILSEVQFKAVRSSGSGGQHVNKVATKVELSFNLYDSLHLSNTQKQLLGTIYAKRLSKEGFLILSSDESRSQLRNKQKVVKRFFDLLEVGLKPKKKRKTTRVPTAVKKKRLDQKKRHSEKKSSRKPPKID